MSDAAWMIAGIYALGAVGSFWPIADYGKTRCLECKAAPYVAAAFMAAFWPTWVIMVYLERALNDR